MTLSSIGSDIFTGDSAVTSHMANNNTGVYDLTPIRGSVMIGNGESIAAHTRASWMLFVSTRMDQWLERHGK